MEFLETFVQRSFVGCSIFFKPITPHNCVVAEMKHAPDITYQPLHVTWYLYIRAVSCENFFRARNGKLAVLFFVKFPIVRPPIRDNDNVINDFLSP